MTSIEDLGPGGNQKITNNGTMTGFITLAELGGNSFTNNGEFVSRNFSVNNANNIRDIRGVAVNDMGGSNSDVINTADAKLTLGASKSDGFDTSGYYAAGTGVDNRSFSSDIYDFSRKGLLQTQFLNTNSFTNGGLIDLTGSQVGNTLVITSGATASDIGTGTFVSDGGTLKLAAVLNDGDGGAGSVADMLITDRVQLGSAPTTIEVVVKDESNAALTKQNGIQLVQVRDKTASQKVLLPLVAPIPIFITACGQLVRALMPISFTTTEPEQTALTVTGIYVRNSKRQRRLIPNLLLTRFIPVAYPFMKHTRSFCLA